MISIYTIAEIQLIGTDHSYPDSEDYVLQNDINVMIILGEKEITDDKVSIKFLDTKQQYTIDRKLFIEKCREASNTSITESLINP